MSAPREGWLAGYGSRDGFVTQLPDGRWMASVRRGECHMMLLDLHRTADEAMKAVEAAAAADTQQRGADE